MPGIRYLAALYVVEIMNICHFSFTLRATMLSIFRCVQHQCAAQHHADAKDDFHSI